MCLLTALIGGCVDGEDTGKTDPDFAVEPGTYVFEAGNSAVSTPAGFGSSVFEGVVLAEAYYVEVQIATADLAEDGEIPLLLAWDDYTVDAKKRLALPAAGSATSCVGIYSARAFTASLCDNQYTHIDVPVKKFLPDVDGIATVQAPTLEGLFSESGESMTLTLTGYLDLDTLAEDLGRTTEDLCAEADGDCTDCPDGGTANCATFVVNFGDGNLDATVDLE